MNRVAFGRFDGLFLPAGNLHAYLHGIGVEIMANSDNVMRGGLTTKHVDVDELVAVLDFTPGVPDLVPVEAEAQSVWRYRTPAPEFALWRVEADERRVVLPGAGTGRIVLVVEGDRGGLRRVEHAAPRPGRVGLRLPGGQADRRRRWHRDGGRSGRLTSRCALSRSKGRAVEGSAGEPIREPVELSVHLVRSAALVPVVRVHPDLLVRDGLGRVSAVRVVGRVDRGRRADRDPSGPPRTASAWWPAGRGRRRRSRTGWRTPARRGRGSRPGTR